MVEDKVEPRESTWRQRNPWWEIFQGFRVALDFNKLILAAAGILVMALGWWLWAVIFYNSQKMPEWPSKEYQASGDSTEAREQAWRNFKSDRKKWNLLHAAAGPADEAVYTDAGDLADSLAEYQALQELKDKKNPDISKEAKERGVDPDRLREKLAQLKAAEAASSARAPEYRKKSGNLRTWPWFEDRGPNPYLMLTGQTTAWERGGFWDWLFNVEVPVLLEPLVKMVRPVVLFFHPDAGPLNSLYFLLVLLWTVVTWAVFGGAITRIAAVQVARQEKLTLSEALRFTTKRWLSFVTAPLFPLLFVLFLLIFMVIFGWFHAIPWFGDIFVDGLFWWLMLIFGLLMAVALIGLIGWPLMSSTVSTEGTDSWEAVSRSYSYVFQAPWSYLGYWLLALAYGAVLILFVGFMGSFAVYLSKWGVSQTPWVQTWNRDPSYLFVYAPTSFGWRPLMLKSVQLQDGSFVVDQQTGQIIDANYAKYMGWNEEYAKSHDKPRDSLSTLNKIGAFMVAVWLYAFFLLILGFGYCYFWSVSAIIYLLMRKKVDDAELDEVYLEEDEAEGGYGGPLTAPAGVAPAPLRPTTPLTMVESPTLKPPETAAVPSGDAAKAPDGGPPSAPSPPPEPAPKTQSAPPGEAPAPEPPPPPPPSPAGETPGT
ncbi:MAG TPA: hypothetical protein VKD72_06225 [Gemmataceae bacterium]|nr:hypothetical protein [Gemmataceae bacterium]